MKTFLNRHPFLQFLLWSGILPLLSVVLSLTYDAYNPVGDGAGNSVIGWIVAVTWPLWWFLAVAHVFGVTELILYGILVNDKMLEQLGLQRILPAAMITSFGSYVLMCFIQFPSHYDWLRPSLVLGTLFAVLPALAVVLLRYILWRRYQRKKQA